VRSAPATSMSTSTTRRVALGLYAVLTLLSFPHEGPGGIAFDFGLVLVWFGPAALIVGIAGLSPRRAARAAFLASLAGHVVLFHWFYVVTVRYGGLSAWLGVFSPLVPALYVSVFTAGFAWAWVRFADRGAYPIWVGAMLWVAFDWLRAHLMGGFPWATLGYALHLDWPLLAWTRWAGVYVLSFLAVAVGIAIGRIWLDRTRDARRELAIVAAIVAIAHVVGIWVGQGDFDSPETVRIAAIQGNIDQGQKWDAELRDRILETYLRLSADAVERGAEWIVWPETAVPGIIEADPVLRDEIGRFARVHQVTLVVGGTGVEIDAVAHRFTAFFDSAFLYDSTGTVRERYDNKQLVPFGEFVPLRALLGRFFKALARGLSSTDIVPGAAPRPIEIEARAIGTPPLRVGIPICYELLFPHVVRHFAAQGAGVLLAITNDAWYGRTGAPHQFLAMTSMRAAESGRWVVRAANTGISAIIDARGRVRKGSALFEEAVIVADVPVAIADSPTFYARFGDGFAMVCVLASVVLYGRRRLGERQHRV
jgi:apolipoprotein N-acyltransferase